MDNDKQNVYGNLDNQQIFPMASIYTTHITCICLANTILDVDI